MDQSKTGHQLVDCVCIGGMKCATSTLYTTLRNHPDIDVTKAKEANFFNRAITTDSIAAYKRQFSGAGHIRCDISPAYAKRHQFPGTADRLFTYAPNAKLIYLVRDPLARAISHVHHNVLRDRLSIQESAPKLIEDDNYRLCSAYAYQIEPYRTHFSRESILVLAFEAFVKNFEESINEIASFLGVEANDQLRIRPSNLSSQRYRIPYYDAFHKRVKNRYLKKIYFNICKNLYGNVPTPAISDKVLDILAESLKPDISRFVEQYPGIDKHWSLYHRHARGNLSGVSERPNQFRQ